jgi:hypothetical protein
MLRLLITLLTVSLAVLVSSCFKEDEKITPHKPGNYITDTVALTDTYKYQAYYNLADSTVASTNLKDLWDFGFESSPNGWIIILNTGCFMKSTYLSGQEFGSAVDTVGAKWLFNPSDGYADSAAIGRWFTVQDNDTIGTNRLLIIDRGIDYRGNPRGLRQLVIDSLVKGTYFFRVANLNGTNPHSYSISKNRAVNHVLFSISNPASNLTEPDKLSWDLFFTQYTTLLYTDVGDPYPYLVTGVLINPVIAEVAVDSITPFASINFEMAQAMNFTRQADRIGYNWKRYDFDAGTYTVNSDLVYIIRDTKGFLYKFRFIGFYEYHSNRLEKGFPSFEYQKL